MCHEDLGDGGVFGVHATEPEAQQAASGRLDRNVFLIQRVPTFEVG